MDKDYIRTRIDFLKQAILDSTDSFTLNPEILNYKAELKKLRAECQHEYENGFCVYCDIKE